MSNRLNDQSAPPEGSSRRNRLDWAAHREQVRAANRARGRAVKQLVKKYRAEFDALYAEQCQHEGVTPRSRRDDSPEAIQKQIEELRKRLYRMDRGEAS